MVCTQQTKEQEDKFAHRKCKNIPLGDIVCCMKYRIKEHRTARNLTQEQLAQLAGSSKGFISQLESGKRDPSAETLRSLAAAFDIDVTEMIAPENDAAREAIDLLEIFQKLSHEDRQAVAHIARMMLPKDDR